MISIKVQFCTICLIYFFNFCAINYLVQKPKSQFQLESNFVLHVHLIFIIIFVLNKLLDAKTERFNNNEPSNNK